jgi:hypothetical protein
MKSAVAKLEMSGKEKEAVRTLEKALKRARKDQKAHEAYEIEMLLVEMLIYKVLIKLQTLIFFVVFFFSFFVSQLFGQRFCMY